MLKKDKKVTSMGRFVNQPRKTKSGYPTAHLKNSNLSGIIEFLLDRNNLEHCH